MTQTLIIHLIRTNRVPFLQSRGQLGLTQVPRMYAPTLMQPRLGYVSLTQIIKIWSLRWKWI